jgi:glycosyltransferase involved in cell wall biosynthesis
MITPEGPHAAAARAHGLRWLPLSLERRLSLRTDVRGSLELAAYFRRERFDIVHTHNIKVGHIGRVLAAAMRVPIVIHTIHGMAYSLDTPSLQRHVHALLERIANLGCDLVLSQSQEDRRTCIATGAISPDRIEVIGNGIDLRRFRPAATDAVRAAERSALGLRPDDVLFVSAGRLIREKGFVELFEAFRRARAREPRIALGRAVYRRSSARRARRGEAPGRAARHAPPLRGERCGRARELARGNATRPDGRCGDGQAAHRDRCVRVSRGRAARGQRPAGPASE